MEKTKTCARCQTTKPVTEFFRNAARHDGLSGYCKPCQTAANSGRQQVQRMQVIDLIGGPVCKRCGFDDVRALTIDHVTGGGSQHRRDTVSTWGIYKHALAHPDEYQVLCWNCNYIKRVEEGEIGPSYRERVLANRREVLTQPTRWARDFDACTTCGTTETKHKAGGVCTNCYMKERRRQQLAGHDRLIARGVIDGNYPADKEYFDTLRAEFTTETVTL